MIDYKFFKKNKGQALVEAALTAPLIVFFLFTIVWFGQIMLTWQQLVSAARYGTDLIAYTPYSKEEIKKDIVNYLCHGNNIGRILSRDPDDLDVKVEINDLERPIDFTLSIDNIGAFNPINILEMVMDSNPIVPAMSYVEIKYRHKIPFILRFYREEIYIKTRLEVLADSGAPKSNRRRR
ncbi:MAG: pilus assembly protein [Endomicrobium sp.]|jgi:hypothetical protein|nr:pilus assembly protein [Endomicrobium sp.]